MVLDLQYYLKIWQLSAPLLLADTPTSKVYIATYNNVKVVLKLFKPAGERDEIKGAIALQYFHGEGAVKLLEHENKAYLIEYAEGDNLESLVRKGEDQKATQIIADVLNKIHNSCTGVLPKELTPLKERFVSLFNKAEKDKDLGPNTIFTEAAEIANFLLKDQKEIRILHGDIHHGNVLYSAKRGWLAIDPKGLVGERTYDAANTLCNPWNMTDLVENELRLLTNATLLAEKLKLDRDRLLSFAFAHACLSASWLLEDSDAPGHALNIAKIIKPHLAKQKPPNVS